MGDRSRADITSAEDKSIGFDYQYYYFMYELLNLKFGQAAGFEYLDDVHIERADGSSLLIQLKHTIKTATDGSPSNLTPGAEDLWKSLSNWAKFICDKNSKRADKASQVAFLKGLEFKLVSNKSNRGNNSILSAIGGYRDGHISVDDLKAAIQTVRAKIKNANVLSYMDTVLQLDDDVFNEFFKRISFDLGKDDIIQSCRTAILEKQIDATRVDDVFHAIDSSVRRDSFAAVKAKEKILLSFEEFNRRYRAYFDKARSGQFIIRKFESPMPENITGQVFLKQLLEIDDVKADELERHTMLTTLRITFRDNVDRLTREGDITENDLEDFDLDACLTWDSRFRVAYPSGFTPTDEAATARSILADLRVQNLTLAGQTLPVRMAHGALYDLSDRPIIGWLSDWKERYK